MLDIEEKGIPCFIQNPGTSIHYLLIGSAHTGEEAIIIARKKAYGITLVDMKLPTINGSEIYLSKEIAI